MNPQDMQLVLTLVALVGAFTLPPLVARVWDEVRCWWFEHRLIVSSRRRTPRSDETAQVTAGPADDETPDETADETPRERRVSAVDAMRGRWDRFATEPRETANEAPRVAYARDVMAEMIADGIAPADAARHAIAHGLLSSRGKPISRSQAYKLAKELASGE